MSKKIKLSSIPTKKEELTPLPAQTAPLEGQLAFGFIPPASESEATASVPPSDSETAPRTRANLFSKKEEIALEPAPPRISTNPFNAELFQQKIDELPELVDSFKALNSVVKLELPSGQEIYIVPHYTGIPNRQEISIEHLLRILALTTALPGTTFDAIVPNASGRSALRLARSRTWSDEETNLIEWFTKERPNLPQEPFFMGEYGYIQVTDPSRFYASLEHDIAQGPDNLVRDLAFELTQLKKFMESP